MNLVMILATKVISDLRQHHLRDDCNSSFPGIVQRKTRRCSSVPPTPSPTKSTKQQFQPALCRIFCVCWLLPIHRHTHTHPFNGPLSGTTQVSRYQKGKTNLDFTEARDSEWHWHQLGHMQVCTSLQTDNHASTPLLSFLQTGCPSCHPTNSVKHWRHKHWPNRQMVQITPITPLRVTHTMM